MNQKSIGFVFAAALLCAACAWGQAASSGMAGTYADVEAASLKKRPQDAWARSIAFKDRIVQGEPGRSQRLDRRTYIPLELQSAGTAWVREDLYPPFAALPADTEFTFGGTVDQFNRRYYLILDAAYRIETLPTQEERWTNVLDNPPAPPAPEILADAAATDPPVPQEAAQDPAEVPSWGDVMSGIVEITAAETVEETPEEPAPADDAEPGPELAAEPEDAPEALAEAEEPAGLPEVPGEEPPADLWAELEAELDEPQPQPIEVAEAPPAVESVEEFGEFDFDDFAGEIPEEPASVPEIPEAAEAAEGSAEDFGDDLDFDSFADAGEGPVPDMQGEAGLAAETEPLEVEVATEAPLEEVAGGEGGPVEDFFDMVEGEIAPPVFDAAAESSPEEPAAEEDFAEVLPEPQTAVPEVAQAADESWHVGPMDEPAPIALVPLVSLQPTKAELAAQEERRREEERQEAIRQKEAERQAKIEAKRQREAEAKRAKAEAAARKKAEAEARAELERARKEAEADRRAEEQRLREEEARAIEAMEAREAQEREAAAQAAAREALQKEYDELAARVEADKAELAERSRMAREVIAAEQAAREEAERIAEKEARLAEELADQEREAADQLAAARAARKAAKKAAKKAARERAEAAASPEEGDGAIAESGEGFFAEAEPAAIPAPPPPPAPAPAARDSIPEWMRPVVF